LVIGKLVIPKRNRTYPVTHLLTYQLPCVDQDRDWRE
jgi:hypothetical protein